MRAIFVAMLLALGIGFIATAESGAVPIGGTALLGASQELSDLTLAQNEPEARRHRSHRVCRDEHREHSRRDRRCHHE
jgi:hypothetical protein